MRRLAPRAITVCSALVLAVWACAWVRGRSVVDRLVLYSSPTRFRAIGLREAAVYYLGTDVFGGVNEDTVDMRRLEGPPGYQPVTFRDTLMGSSMYREEELLGFFHGRIDIALGQELTEASVPLWPLAVASFMWLAIGVPALARRAELRRYAGICASCGDDLRATPGRCPECGAAAAAR